MEQALLNNYIYRENLPYEAVFLAGKCFLKYRKSGGIKHALFQDFYIGVHAAVRGWNILTRDNGRYQTYFPTIRCLFAVIGSRIFIRFTCFSKLRYSNHAVQAGMPMTANGDIPAPPLEKMAEFSC